MITRADYMANSNELHQAYYAEVAEAASIKITDAKLLAEVREALANGDEPLNTIPLGKWDAMASNASRSTKLREALKARGDFYSLGTGVCAMKAAAKAAVA